MPQLILGPLLRYTGTTQATVWVETDSACEVAVLDARSPTFCVEGHHYALVAIDGLEPGVVRPYEVHLDGERVWPPDDGRPPSVIATRDHERQARLIFGSCRAGSPQRRPFTLSPKEHESGFGVDALWAYSRRLQEEQEPWPDCLLLMGDQVYADELPPETRDSLITRLEGAASLESGAAPPSEEVANFEEYTRLHRESWSDPDIRWLLSTVPSTMIFDDHDVHDDWNISESWVADIRTLPWWEERIIGAFMAYWIYQHIGNLAPTEFDHEPMLRSVYDDDDAGPRLREFARTADRDTTAARFAFHRDFGRTRLVVVDARAARVVTEGKRDIVDADEWEWIAGQTRGDFDHLIIASTVPVFLAHGIQHLEAWNEAVCSGAWGRVAARVGERIRRGLDLDHWGAFQRSFRTMMDLLRERSSATDRESPAPATIMLLGGDVHTAYIADVTLSDAQTSRVYQLVCSPFRKPMTGRERLIVRLLFTRGLRMFTRGLARTAGVAAPTAKWRVVAGPTFHNSIGAIDVDERTATVSIRQSGTQGDDSPHLERLHDYDLTGASPRARRRPRLRARHRRAAR